MRCGVYQMRCVWGECGGVEGREKQGGGGREWCGVCGESSGRQGEWGRGKEGSGLERGVGGIHRCGEKVSAGIGQGCGSRERRSGLG